MPSPKKWKDYFVLGENGTARLISAFVVRSMGLAFVRPNRRLRGPGDRYFTSYHVSELFATAEEAVKNSAKLEKVYNVDGYDGEIQTLFYRWHGGERVFVDARGNRKHPHGEPCTELKAALEKSLKIAKNKVAEAKKGLAKEQRWLKRVQMSIRTKSAKTLGEGAKRRMEYPLPKRARNRKK